MQMKFIETDDYVDNTTTQSQATVLRIGTAITLDPHAKYATLGGAMKNAFTMYFDWLNKHQGGVHIKGTAHVVELVLVDDRSDKSTVEKITDYLLHTLGLRILLAPYSSGLTGMASPKANLSGAVMVAAGSSALSVFEGRPTVFGTLTPSSQFLVGGFQMLGQAAATESTRQRLAYVQEDTSWTKGVCSKVPNLALGQNFDLLPGGDITVPADADEDAARVAVEQLATLAPDIVTMCVYRTACHSILKQMRSQEFYAKATISTICVTEGDFIDVLGTAGLYVLGVTPWVPTLPLTSEIASGWTAKSFAAEYQARFGAVPPYQAASAWASCAALVRAIEEANSTDPLLIADKLRAANYASMYGTVAFDANGQCTNEMKVVQYQGDPSFRMLYPSANADGTFVYPKPSWADIECMNLEEGVKSRYGMTEGVCGECAAGRYSHVVSIGNSKERVCEKCPKGQMGVDMDFQICIDCPAGSMSDTLGADKCTLCTPGAFQNVSGKSECHGCEPGRAASEKGMDACTPCPKGMYSGDAAGAATTCDLCPKGTYASSIGSKDCQACDQTTGKTTATIGTTSAAECMCPAGTEEGADGFCNACEKGVECPGGSEEPISVAGFYANVRGELPTEAFSGVHGKYSVFKCFQDELRCPAGKIGTCAAGRKGIACAECQDSMVPGDKGTCVDCRSSDKVFFSSAFIVLLGMVVVLYKVVDGEDPSKKRRALLFVGMASGMSVSFVQQMGVLSTMTIPWVEPVKSLLSAMRLLHFDVEVVRMGCMMAVSPFVRYIGTLVAMLILIAWIVPVHFVWVWLKHGARFLERMPALICVVGTIFVMFLTAIMNVTILPLQCKEHPNKLQTVWRYPTVICWEQSEHAAMLAVGMIALLLVLGIVSCLCFVTYLYPRRTQALDTQFLHKFAFLFFRFSPDVYWFAIVFILRNACIALVPTVPNSVAQIVLMVVLLVGYLVAVAMFLPWRVEMANYLDVIITFHMILIMCVSGMFITDADLESVAILCSVFLTLNFALLLCGVTTSITVNIRQHYVKEFDFFICHHKGGAGAFARLLKIQLVSDNKSLKVFIDCDDLTNVQLLFDYVRCRCETVVSLLSKDILLRPWCIGEMVTAHSEQALVKLVPVVFPGYANPDDNFIKSYGTIVDISCLGAYGINISMTQAMLQWLRDIPALTMPSTELLSISLMKELGTVLVNKSYQGKSIALGTSMNRTSTTAAFSKVAAVADRTDLESIATGLVLCKLMAKHMAQSAAMVPVLLLSGDDLPQETDACIFVLSSGILLKLDFIRTVIQAAQLNARHIPIITEDNFRFPSKDLKEDLAKVLPAVVDAMGEKVHVDMLLKLLMGLFKEIAVVFAPQDYSSTEALLQIKAKTVADRLLGLEMQRNLTDSYSPSEFSVVPVQKVIIKDSDTATMTEATESGFEGKNSTDTAADKKDSVYIVTEASKGTLEIQDNITGPGLWI